MDSSPRREEATRVVAEIRRLTHSQAQALARIRREMNPAAQWTPESMSAEVRRLVEGGGRAWIIHLGQAVAGYASVTPAPGLPGLFELDGFISPAHRRQRLGSAMLKAIIDRLAASGIRQLAYPVPDAETAAARLLLKHGFYIEHEEQLLVLEDLASLPAVGLDHGFSLRTFARSQAIAHFRRLYVAAFSSLAWYQPYDDDEEVDSDLADAHDLLFLIDGHRPIGFLWLRWPAPAAAEIEPVGLLPAYRGRGLGRQLMLAGLSQAAQQGATKVSVGAWQANTAALVLYRRLGFRLTSGILYLAYDL